MKTYFTKETVVINGETFNELRLNCDDTLIGYVLVEKSKQEGKKLGNKISNFFSKIFSK
jgi:hypothetical protein